MRHNILNGSGLEAGRKRPIHQRPLFLYVFPRPTHRKLVFLHHHFPGRCRCCRVKWRPHPGAQPHARRRRPPAVRLAIARRQPQPRPACGNCWPRSPTPSSWTASASIAAAAATTTRSPSSGASCCLTVLLRHKDFEACLAELRRNEGLRRLIGIDDENRRAEEVEHLAVPGGLGQRAASHALGRGVRPDGPTFGPGRARAWDNTGRRRHGLAAQKKRDEPSKRGDGRGTASAQRRPQGIPRRRRQGDRRWSSGSATSSICWWT